MSSAARSSPRITARITALDVLDVRFPTSEHLDGSNAMNPEPDYSAAYVVLRTDGHYLPPTQPGLSAQMHPESLTEHLYPDGPVWAARV